MLQIVKVELFIYLVIENKAGSGGAISIESSASMQMFNTNGVGNIAEKGDGGFLFARVAVPILLSNVTIDAGSAKENGGGIASYSSRVALDGWWSFIR